MNTKLRQQLRKRNQRIRRRIDKRKGVFQSPAVQPSTTKFELSEKTQAISCGGIGIMMQIVKQLDLRKYINQAMPVLKMHLPYDETDHVLNIAMNLLAGGTCLEHIELRRTDEAYLNALGAERIPDPTTAGDFCRRFDSTKIMELMQGINRARQQVWKQQPEGFLDQATIEADGTMVETYGEKKQGIGINHKGQWGYHPLVVTLAETQEILYLANRSGNRPSHEHSARYFNSAIELCKEAGFRKIRLRGDTDFSSTAHLDRWDRDGVTFVLDTLESNWAYMVIASLAWTLKLWSGMLVRVQGNPNQLRVRSEIRRKVIRMEFSTYLNSLMLIPAQVIRGARQLKLRLLAYRPSVECLLTLSDHISLPLRC